MAVIIVYPMFILLLCSILQSGIIHIFNAEVLENAVRYFFTRNGPKKLSSNSPNNLLGTLRKWHNAVIVLVSACKVANMLRAMVAHFNPALMLRCEFGLCVINSHLYIGCLQFTA